jgi:type II secretory pathway component PulC
VRGALVFNVSQTVSDQTGLQTGDVILQINNTPIHSAEDVQKAINYYGNRTYLRVTLERQGQLGMTEFALR